MMTHPGRDVLLAHVDGELPDRDELAVARHVAGCAQCGAMVSENHGNSAMFARTLLTLDDDEPAHWSQLTDDITAVVRDAGPVAVDPDAMAIDAGTVAAADTRGSRALPLRAVRPASHSRMARSSDATRPSRVNRRDALRWAAGIFLVTFAAASATIIGRSVLFAPNETTTPPTPTGSAEPSVVAVIVMPLDGTLRVALTGAGAGSRVHVILEDRTDASVAVEGADAPRFTAVAGSVAVDLRGAPGIVRLTLPRTLREATVTADDDTLAVVRDGVISPANAAAAGIPLDAAVTGPDME